MKYKKRFTEYGEGSRVDEQIAKILRENLCLWLAVRKVRYEREVVIHCRGCKTMETLWFKGKTMIPTKKFSQRRGYVYHDCGTKLPCLLLWRW